jgi:hypothetical protein
MKDPSNHPRPPVARRRPRRAAAGVFAAWALVASVAGGQAPPSPDAEASPTAAGQAATAEIVSLPAEDVSFLIEALLVEGLSSEAAQRIVAEESLLVEGQSYGEAELREALHRVRRLPFVVEAELALSRGSERGAYALTFVVTPAKPIAYGVELLGFESSRQEGGVETGFIGTLGARKFVGRRGMLFGSVQGIDASGAGQVYQLGYTQHGVFRRGGFLTIAGSTHLGSDQDFESSELAMETGIPLGGNHALRAGLTWSEQGDDSGFFTFSSKLAAGQLEWIYDDTDDPFVPLDGLRLSAEGGYSRSRSSYLDVFPGSEEPPREQLSEQETVRLRGEARRYWRVAPRQALGLGFTAQYVEHDNEQFADNSEGFATVEAIYAASLLDFERTRRIGDLRFETSIGFEHFEERHERQVDDESDNSGFLRGTLTFRHAWGVVRISAVYLRSFGGRE